MNENEIDIDPNEVEDININALTPKQKALRLNALVKMAKGDVFTTHDFEEALSLTRQLMKR
jgi:ABC-type proline/glycine betaine transport system ATPase subunit